MSLDDAPASVRDGFAEAAAKRHPAPLADRVLTVEWLGYWRLAFERRFWTDHPAPPEVETC